VIKPAEDTPLSALAIVALAEEAGIPKGVVNLVTTSREQAAEVGRELCTSPLLRKLSFTGSTDVGKWLLRECASTVKKVSLELGGNAPFLVFDDADLEVAVKAAVASKFRNAGQTCISINRMLVQEGIYDTFANALAEAVSALNVGHGDEHNTDIGPLINVKGFQKVQRHVDDMISKGGNVLTGGAPHPLGGTFFTPTVVKGAQPYMCVWSEETFGPVAPLFKFKTEDEALAMANDTRFGLAAYACTSNLGRAWRLAEGLESGLVGINETLISTEVAPFGGWKESGLGREGSKYGIDEYLELKHVCMGALGGPL
jgi:succinate-semialdehyde dehydrogenase/glutarate-semialdehyde dehydrogenase